MEFSTLILARVLHVLAVVLWIGGVAMVTTVILPSLKKTKSKEEFIRTFEILEHRFAWQARITAFITGITGFYMLYELNGWNRYLQLRYWWIHTMTLVWVLFSVVLYILEPLILHKMYSRMAAINPERTFRIIKRLHWVLLLLSMFATAGAVAGSHGWF